MGEDLEYTKKLLEIEYAQVRARIAAVDETRFKIKGWAVTVSTGLLALGFTRGQRWIMVLSLPVAILLCVIEADYLLRQDALWKRSTELEAVMDSLRRPDSDDAVSAYVFGLRAVPSRGYAGRGFPRMFGSRTRAGWGYATIVVVALFSMIMLP